MASASHSTSTSTHSPANQDTNVQSKTIISTTSPAAVGNPGPQYLSLELGSLNLDDHEDLLDSGLGKSAIPSPESSYDIVNPSDCENQHAARQGYSESPGPLTPFSDGVFVQRPSPNIDESKVVNDTQGSENWQLDGIGDTRSEFSDEPTYSRPTGGLRVRNLATPSPGPRSSASSIEPRQQNSEYQYIAYSPNIHPQHTPQMPAYDDQADRMFDDFDGVHCEIDLHLDQPAARPSPPVRPRSYAHPPAQVPQHPPGLVYYPAPVPAMLKLPPTLSKPRENKRESKMLSNRQSMALDPPPTTNIEPHNNEPSQKKKDMRKSLANLPPSLRASVFFDQLPSPTTELQPQGGSAVATLESILDASAKAPPVAFTDHPIAGGLPFQPPVHARSRSSVMLNNRQSTASLATPQQMNRQSMATIAGYRSSVALVGDRPQQTHRDSQLSIPVGLGGGDDSSAGNSDEHPRERPDSQLLSPNTYFMQPETPPPAPMEHNTLPTTLLAELESRKAELKSRSRTAASAFPGGMRSTLLELDAVAQVQKEQRRQKRTNLAWENPEDVQQQYGPDEDVPLGLLYAGANVGGNATRMHKDTGMKSREGAGDEDVPLGLIAKRTMEDNEPLSKRKERLKGLSASKEGQDQKRETVFLEVPGIGTPPANEEPEEIEGESLAVRMKRIRDQKTRESSGFGSGSLGLNLDGGSLEDVSLPKEQRRKTMTSLPALEVEESLAQRRKRLQAEKDLDRRKLESVFLQQEVKLRNRKSMVDIIQHQQSLPLHLRTQQAQSGLFPATPGSFSMGGMGIGMVMGIGNTSYSATPGLVGGIPGVNTPHAGGGMLGMGGGMMSPMTSPGYRGSMMSMGGVGGMGMQSPTYAAGLQMQMQLPVTTQNAKQNEMIERWRSSVMGGINPS